MKLNCLNSFEQFAIIFATCIRIQNHPGPEIIEIFFYMLHIFISIVIILFSFSFDSLGQK